MSAQCPQFFCSLTLRSDEVFEVEAVNEYHAGSKVVFGDAANAIQADGKVAAPVKVHRENIERVVALA